MAGTSNMSADRVRDVFTRFFAERGHAIVPSASLIPHDPTVLFTIAGMVPFKPYFLGEQEAPWPRATSVQKCFRTLDIDVVGTTERHFTFFEMLGNFSFGDYFKELAIPYAWELVTEALGLDSDRLWVTVHDNDDEAERIWTEDVGVAPERIQRMGEDNFWKMGDTGPCGPCSEIYFDRGDRHGAGGGPAHGAPERFVEIWNLVFMQYDRRADGTLTDLPKRNIDTGAGLERILPIVEGVDSPYETDLLAPVLEKAQSLTGVRYGRDPSSDVSLRIIADHSRAMTMLCADGVVPANEGRGYVLRRVIRRAVRRAHQLGVQRPIAVAMVDRVAEVLGSAWPALIAEIDLVRAVVEREEDNFRRTLASGFAILGEELAQGKKLVDGEVAFRLHDTHGFPIELTVEMAAEAGAEVDLAGFERAMAAQRERAKADARAKRAAAGDEVEYRRLLESIGPTRFTGYEHYEEPARIVAVLAGSGHGEASSSSSESVVEIVLDRTPFYAEAGGQVGDTGVITTETGKAIVTDTQAVLPGLVVHKAKVSGEIFVGQDALAVIDADRREAIRRNHTATHLLHAALRTVLGDHVRQQGSLVAPQRLRFDFSHPSGLRAEELRAVEEVANEDVLSDAPVQTLETSRAEAQAMGALAFFGDKYGERVRVVRAGPHSTELCGGTHVGALGMIGPITVVSEGSIGSNTRRIEAVSGRGALALLSERSHALSEAARMLKVEPDSVGEAIERLLERQRNSEKELARLRAGALGAEASALVSQAEGSGMVVARRDGLGPDELRELAQAVRGRATVPVVLAGSPDGTKVSIVAATGGEPPAGALVKELAVLVGGGGGGSPDLAVAGGRDTSSIDELLADARRRLGR